MGANFPIKSLILNIFEGKLHSNELFTSVLRFSVVRIVTYGGYISNFLSMRLLCLIRSVCFIMTRLIVRR